MFKRSRKRAANLALIGTWLGASVTVVASLAWLVSAIWNSFFMAQFGDSVMLRSGGVSYLWTWDSHRAAMSTAEGWPLRLQWQWHCVPRQSPMEWWGTFYQVTPKRGQIWIPLWPIALAGGAVAAVCWRHRRRLTRAGCCEGCGYVLAGLPNGGVCPECGEAIPKAGMSTAVTASGNGDRLV